jgi:hypothetical protein
MNRDGYKTSRHRNIWQYIREYRDSYERQFQTNNLTEYRKRKKRNKEERMTEISSD